MQRFCTVYPVPWGSVLLPSRSWLRAVETSATRTATQGERVCGGGVVSQRWGLAGGPRLRERGADKRGILQGAEGGANYGVNPTRLAPQAAAAVRALEQDF